MKTRKLILRRDFLKHLTPRDLSTAHGGAQTEPSGSTIDPPAPPPVTKKCWWTAMCSIPC